MRTVPIEQLHEKLTYDAATGILYDKSSGQPLGNPNKGYLKVSVNGVSLSVHRIAWAMHHGEWPAVQVDHRDQNRANNKIDNLRLATNSQNNMNVGAHGAVDAKGVCWDAKRAKYRAQIKVHGMPQHIGYFDTEDEAAHAYNKQAVELHGEFAVLNPIGLDSKERPPEVFQPIPVVNGADWVTQGTLAAGERHGAAKLTKDQVLIIRETYAARKTYQWGAAKLAKEFGVSKRAVQLVAKAGTWNGLVKAQQDSAQVAAKGGEA